MKTTRYYLQNIIEIYKNNNQEVFYNRELNNMKITNVPPYSYIASIEISSKSEDKALQFANKIKNTIVLINKTCEKDTKIIGPIKPVLHKINYKYRYKILVMHKYPLINYIKKMLLQIKKPNNVGLTFDLNPYDFI